MNVLLGYDLTEGVDADPIVHKMTAQNVGGGITLIGHPADRRFFRERFIDRVSPDDVLHADFHTDSAEEVRETLERLWAQSQPPSPRTIVFSFEHLSRPEEEELVLPFLKRGPMYGMTTIAEFYSLTDSIVLAAQRASEKSLFVGPSRHDTYRLRTGMFPPSVPNDAYVETANGVRPLLYV